MASIGTEPMTEKMMWGMIPVDQMVCRIWFNNRRYDGDFTTQSTNETLIFPGNFGGFNWGSVSVDPTRNILAVSYTHLTQPVHYLVETGQGGSGDSTNECGAHARNLPPVNVSPVPGSITYRRNPNFNRKRTP